MTTNSLEWGYDSTGAFDIFSTPVSERKIMDWVIKVDSLLHILFERVDGVEVRGALHEGIKRFLDARKAEAEEEIERATIVLNGQVSKSMHNDGESGDVKNGEYIQDASSKDAVPKWRGETTVADAESEADEFKEDFDISQFVDLHGGVRSDSPVRVIKKEDEYGDDLEDEEMLMGN